MNRMDSSNLERGMGQPSGLRLHCGNHAQMTVADVHDTDADDEVDTFSAISPNTNSPSP